ncbi:MAG: DEAD/DEAH box helicase [Flavobacteriales bacterium]
MFRTRFYAVEPPYHLGTFEDLGLSAPILRALQPLGYQKPTPIQHQAIPHVLKGRDVLGCAQTGTGKTAAFALPMIHNLHKTQSDSGRRRVRGLILSPTRELATQIADNLRDYNQHTGLRHALIFGGVSQGKQVNSLQRGVDIIVATPGRLLDLANQGYVHLQGLEFFVLDEADTMLDMGFIHDIRRIIQLLPRTRQSLFFSATMPGSIIKLSESILTDPIQVEVARVSSAAETVEQRIMSVAQVDKRDLLVSVLRRPDVSSALVFTRTKYGADKVVRYLKKHGIRSEAIHGNKTQPQRDRAMIGFRKGKINVLVATDIAARGIDVDELSHVINFEVPNLPETYVHRIGRTGRAGSSGQAYSFVNEADERTYLRDIQSLIQKEIEVDDNHDWHLDMPAIGMKTSQRTAPPQKKKKSKHTPSGKYRGSKTRWKKKKSPRPSGDRG